MISNSIAMKSNEFELIFSIFELCREMLRAMVFFQLVTAALYISGVNFELETVAISIDKARDLSF